jgi:hypothetical protein
MLESSRCAPDCRYVSPRVRTSCGVSRRCAVNIFQVYSCTNKVGCREGTLLAHTGTSFDPRRRDQRTSAVTAVHEQRMALKAYSGNRRRIEVFCKSKWESVDRHPEKIAVL